MAFFTKRYHPPGTPPGTLVQLPAEEAAPLQIRLTDFRKDHVLFKDSVEASECRSYLESDSITWIHVQGHPTEAALQSLGKTFNLHSLALEDVLNTGQRPKVDEFGDQLFVVMSLPTTREDRVEIEQVSFFLEKTFLISFCEGDFAPFMPVIRRLQDNGSRLRSRGVDYLFYSLIDVVIDQGFPVLENFGLELEELEEQILESVGRDTLQKLHTIKRELILLRRMLWPQREAINQLLRGDSDFFSEETLVYLHDCYDHTIQVMDLLETYRDMAGSMLDIYLSSVSNRMNEVMRVLTVIATIFIPLTFIVGVYGMNFDRSAGPMNMPELGWPFGYVLIWVVMITLAATMVVFFRRRGWF